MFGHPDELDELTTAKLKIAQQLEAAKSKYESLQQQLNLKRFRVKGFLGTIA